MKLFVDNLTNVDFSFLHPERGLLGESWFARLQLSGPLNDEGMVCDFGLVKSRVRDWLDTHIDHCLLIPTHLKDLKVNKDSTNTEIHWQYPDGKRFYCKSPHCAITLIDTDKITEHSLAQWCEKQLLALFEDNVLELALRFEPEQLTKPFYHYSHGLKKHDGNCQRIAHGHRSPIEIFVDGKSDNKLEQQWVKLWQDIYIGSNEDLQKNFSENGNEYFHYAYQSGQGKFELTLPQEVCYNIDTDSTVEWIAYHIHQELSKQYPDKRITVKAFEGIGKGAIVSSE